MLPSLTTMVTDSVLILDYISVTFVELGVMVCKEAQLYSTLYL